MAPWSGTASTMRFAGQSTNCGGVPGTGVRRSLDRSPGRSRQHSDQPVYRAAGAARGQARATKLAGQTSYGSARRQGAVSPAQAQVDQPGLAHRPAKAPSWRPALAGRRPVGTAGGLTCVKAFLSKVCRWRHALLAVRRLVGPCVNSTLARARHVGRGSVSPGPPSRCRTSALDSRLGHCRGANPITDAAAKSRHTPRTPGCRWRFRPGLVATSPRTEVSGRSIRIP